MSLTSTGNPGDVHADVVARDDLLRRDRHRHDPKGDAAHPVDEGDHQHEARPARALAQASESEYHAALVLLEDPDRSGEQYDGYRRNEHEKEHVTLPDGSPRRDAAHPAIHSSSIS
jgi:hypothetical protein